MMENSRVAVASRSFSKHPVLRSALEARCRNVTFNDAGRSLAGPDLVAFLRGHDKAITGLERLDASVFDAVPELRVISKYGVGLDTIDLRAMEERGLKLGWTGGVNRRSVAELTISAAIALLHGVPVATREVIQGTWRQTIGRQLTGRTVGIVGCGHVGKEVAILAGAFGCRVLAYDILDFPEFYAAHGVQPVDLTTLLRTSDVVTLHLPLDGTTRRMFNADRLSLLRPDAVLINMARGGLVDETALNLLLRKGHLAGAALDVFEDEPPLDRALIELPNVIATPHIGGSTEEAILAMGQAAIAGLDDARLPRHHGLLQCCSLSAPCDSHRGGMRGAAPSDALQQRLHPPAGRPPRP
jgi:phosphoglycerate dehydrogenase-like enzyme